MNAEEPSTKPEPNTITCPHCKYAWQVKFDLTDIKSISCPRCCKRIWLKTSLGYAVRFY
jgi:predicted  nucleic acid-binding Zn ribbon protein